jgi:hypothetical protein
MNYFMQFIKVLAVPYKYMCKMLTKQIMQTMYNSETEPVLNILSLLLYFQIIKLE